MKLLEYEYTEGSTGFSFSKVNFERINLLVGDTGTGKTKFLNTIFNLGRQAVSKELDKYGNWTVKFDVNGEVYKWIINIEPDEDDQKMIVEDNLYKVDGESEIEIIKRDENHFVFEGKELPKLSRSVASISLLKDEPVIKPLFDGFGAIMKRDFYKLFSLSEDKYEILSNNEINGFEKNKSLEKLFHMNHDVNIKLYFLSIYFNEIYNNIILQIKEVFNFITDVKITDIQDKYGGPQFAGKIPMLSIKEKNVEDWLDYAILSAGMRKVITILTDSYILPKGALYLIDEYENSLGINAIDFLPTFLLSEQTQNQFILTSHHPYIINKIPVKNWYIFNRKGSNVSIKFGAELSEKFSKSKQQAFIQLINDPFFNRGID